jgi:histidinol-phosphatase
VSDEARADPVVDVAPLGLNAAMKRARELDVALAAALAGGEVSRRYFGSGVAVEQKSDHSPVTAADREAEQRIVEVISAAFPAHGFLGEEFGERGAGDIRWIVDPIDGTRNFIRGLPFFAVLLALEEEGEITLGVVHEPVSGDVYWASKGEGAHGPAGRLAVSDVDSLADGTIAFGTLGTWRKGDRWSALERLVGASRRQRGYGDYLSYLFVARGFCEAMIEPELKPWDMAPFKILVEEAGGRLSDLSGKATVYGGSCLVSNGRLHEALLASLKG